MPGKLFNGHPYFFWGHAFGTDYRCVDPDVGHTQKVSVHTR